MNYSTVKTHDDVTVGADGWSESGWLKSEGFQSLAITLMCDAFADCTVDVHWSHDGDTYHGTDLEVIKAGSQIRKAGEVSVKARYFNLTLHNIDLDEHRYTIHAYLTGQ